MNDITGTPDELNIENQIVKVSVIIPIYNACKYIRPALDSVIAQTLREIEIICVDDGSTDTSLDMIKIYQKQDSRIRIITETNAGPALARNNGLQRARGEYVAFLDADDFFELNMLEKLYNKAKEDDLDISISRYDIYNNKKGKFMSNVESEYSGIYAGGVVTSKNEHPEYILQSTTGAAWNKLFRKSFLMEKGITFLTEVMMFEDVYFTVSALAFAERVGMIDDILLHHRIHNGQSRAKQFKKHYNQVPDVYLRIKEFLMKGGMYQPLNKAFLNLSASRCYHIFNLLRSDSKEKFFNLLHEGYYEKLGWADFVAEDFQKPEVCEFTANIAMYTYDQYEKRNKRGMKLKKEQINYKLKLNSRRKRLREFFVKLFKKKTPKDQ